EILKLAVRRPRPFEAIANAPGALPAPETVVAHPSSFSFPSGDAALAMGAAVAFASVAPRYRTPILLLGIAAALARVVVGVHYPFDVLGGMTIGVISGVAAPRAIALLRRRLRWRAFVIPHTHWDREGYERFEGDRARLVPMVSRLLDILVGGALGRSGARGAPRRPLLQCSTAGRSGGRGPSILAPPRRLEDGSHPRPAHPVREW